MDVFLKYEDKLNISARCMTIYHAKGKDYGEGCIGWCGAGISYEEGMKNRAKFYAKPLEEKIDTHNAFRYELECDKMSNEEIEEMNNSMSLLEDPDVRYEYIEPKYKTIKVPKEECKLLIEQHKKEFDQKRKKYEELTDMYVSGLSALGYDIDIDDVGYTPPTIEYPCEWFDNKQELFRCARIILFFHKGTKMYQWFKDNGWLMKYAPSDLIK